MKVKIKKLTTSLVGETFSMDCSVRGQQVHNRLKELGADMQNGPGADIKDLGVEIKSRKINAISAETIGSISPEDIISTAWENTHLFEKTQTLHKYKLNEAGNVVSENTFDFSRPSVQEKLKEGYEACRADLIKNGPTKNYIHPNGSWVYLERIDGKKSYQLRTKKGKELETLSKSTIDDIFEFGK